MSSDNKKTNDVEIYVKTSQKITEVINAKNVDFWNKRKLSNEHIKTKKLSKMISITTFYQKHHCQSKKIDCFHWSTKFWCNHILELYFNAEIEIAKTLSDSENCAHKSDTHGWSFLRLIQIKTFQKQRRSIATTNF